MVKDGLPKSKEEHSETLFGVFLGGGGREREIGISESLSLSFIVLPVIILFADLKVVPKPHIRTLFDFY